MGQRSGGEGKHKMRAKKNSKLKLIPPTADDARDEGADARRNPQRTQPESVKTGRTIEQVAQDAAR